MDESIMPYKLMERYQQCLNIIETDLRQGYTNYDFVNRNHYSIKEGYFVISLEDKGTYAESDLERKYHSDIFMLMPILKNRGLYDRLAFDFKTSRLTIYVKIDETPHFFECNSCKNESIQ